MIALHIKHDKNEVISVILGLNRNLFFTNDAIK
jgi:hypothetical protein